jgi:RES domain-containing protein
LSAVGAERVDEIREQPESTPEGLIAWRLVRPAYGDREVAFSGEGARRYGGRWNTPGRPMVYASLHLSLAALETLAHADRRRFERDYLSYEVRIPHTLVLELRDDDLPNDWRARPSSPGARSVGDAWLAQRASVALSVPSVLVPQERNLLLNPQHPRFGQVRISAAQRFRFDDHL